MKKILLYTILLTLPTSANAIQTMNVSEAQYFNESTTQQVKNSNNLSSEKFDLLAKRYYNDLRECVPFHYNQRLDFFGLKINFNIDINGWNTQNKCEYKITGNIDSIGKDIREVYNVKVSDEKISEIRPVFECKFTKEQLNILAEAMISKNQNNTKTISKMLESPEKSLKHSKKENLTPEEEKFIAMLSTENACIIPNKDELMEKFTEILQSQENL